MACDVNPAMLPYARPVNPAVQIFRRTSPNVRMSSLERVSGGEKARDMLVMAMNSHEGSKEQERSGEGQGENDRKNSFQFPTLEDVEERFGWRLATAVVATSTWAATGWRGESAALLHKGSRYDEYCDMCSDVLAAALDSFDSTRLPQFPHFNSFDSDSFFSSMMMKWGPTCMYEQHTSKQNY